MSIFDITKSLPVADPEAEINTLALMIQESECLEAGITELTAGHFCDGGRRAVFEIIGQMYGQDKSVNMLTVSERAQDLIRQYGLANLGICGDYGLKSMFPAYVAKLKKVHHYRRLVEQAQKIVQGVHDFADPEVLSAEVADELYGVATEDRAEPIITPGEQAERIVETVSCQMDEDERKKHSIYTSFKRLNYLTGGFNAGDLVIISGPTGGGKTALAMNFVRDIALVQKLPALYINTEMSRMQIDMRWAAMLAKDPLVNNSTIRAGEITQEQFAALVADLDLMHAGQLYSVTIPDLTAPKMVSVIRRFARQKKIRAVAVDYIGRIDTMNSPKDDWKQLLAAAKKLKTIGQQLDLVVFMVAQVNKEGYLAMASQIEHEADLHLHIRPLAEKEEREFLSKLITWWNYYLVVAKGRSCPTGKIPVRFAKEKLTFLMDEGEARRHAALAGQQQQQDADRAFAETAGGNGYSGNMGRSRQRNMPYSD
jgi:replicative DNA helicase